MTPEHWEQVALLHRAALQCEESRRAAFLNEACAGDEDLRCEVESLLAYEGKAENFMEVPALEVVAKQLAESQGLGMIQRSGTKLGPYEILAPLGSGGMGEVYRARDSSLNRDVALKILPAMFTDDAERMARFRREAQVLASLNHPNIGSIYGLEESNNLRVLVLELVEGPTLADRITGGAIPLEEVLAIAHQIADAVAYAHEKGVTHRDLKPANIKITPEGNVKVLDFGLAKVLEPPKDLNSNPSDSPTYQNPTTLDGMILGTAAYMSPEQAKGKPVDKRADIWAFGVVLYELLTGGHLFHRETMSDTLAAVLKEEPDWNRIPVTVRPLLQHCLEKNPNRRLRDVGDMHLLLETTSVPLQTKRFWLAWGAVAVFVVAFAALSLIHFRERPLVSAPVQFQISPSGSLLQSLAFAVSPDGRHLAFSATDSDGVARLWIRDLESLEIRALPNSYPVSLHVTGSAVVPPFFWSPDSRFIGFQSGGKLAKIEVSGGPAQTLCEVQGTVVGGAWNRDGVIVFADVSRGLMQVSADGGVASPLTTFDPSRKEVVHVLPSFLPDGRHFLYLRASRSPENSGVYVGSLDTKPEAQDSRRLLAATSGPVYVPSSESDSGQVLFLRQGTLMAQPFDARRLELSGEAVPVAAQVGSFLDYGFFSASSNGVLVYRSGVGLDYQLTWLDRQGRVLAKLAEPGRYNSLALSPDGRRVAVSRTNPENTPNWDVWLLDVGRNTSTRLTYEQVRANRPVWSADGSSIIFDSIRGGEVNLYLKLASGAGDERLLLKSVGYKYGTSSSRDGRFLLYTVENPETKTDLWVLPLLGDGKPTPFLRTEFNERSGQFSPDGHWIAYISDESGKDEIYVREFSSGSAKGSGDVAGKWLISKGGGTDPRWRGDGKELFYLASGGKLTSVDISNKPVFQAGVPRPLAQLPPGFIGGEVTADGRRFLIGVPAALSASVPFTVVLNWQATLKK